MADRSTRRGSWRKWLFLPPLLIGGAAFVILGLLRDPPVRRDATEAARPLRVITIVPMDVVPRAVGYGTARPARVWRAVAEVPGRVVAAHDDLRAGALVREGSELLRIDPAEYELAIAQLTADLAKVDAEITELDRTVENLRASLKIEEDSLTLAEADLERTRSALGRGAANRSEVDGHERTMLAQRKLVQDLRNTINLMPAQRKAADAGRAVKHAQREIAGLNLSKTVLVTPFDCRIGAVDIQLGQYLQANETLFQAFGTDRTEVEAQIRLGAMRSLVRGSVRAEMTTGGIDLERLREVLDVNAVVRVNIGSVTGRWEARFDRIREIIDPQTRTVGVVVVVDRPYDKIVPGERPPLIEGAYCEVELRGPTRSGRVVVPRASVHEGAVYVVDADGRLERRTVRTEFEQGGIACIESGLAPGEIVIVSDPIPAIEGMLVKMLPDDDLLAWLSAEARGEDGPGVIRFIVEHRTAANLLMGILILMGLLSLPGLLRDTFPDFAAAELEIRAVYSGATAAEVDESVCQRLMDALDGVESVKEVRSDAREGIGVVVVEMVEGGDFQTFRSDVETEVGAIDDFPVDVEDPVIDQLGTTDHVLSVLVAGPLTAPHLKAFCEQFKDRLQLLDAVSLVTIEGFSDHQLRIELSPLALKSHGLSVSEVAERVNRQSVDLPAGDIETRDRDVVVRFNEQRRTPAELEALVIVAGRGGAEVQLGDLGRVIDTFETTEDKIELDGVRAGLVRIDKTKEEDTIRVANAVRDLLAEERLRHPRMRYAVTQDNSLLVTDRLRMLLKNGAQGIVLVFLAMWVFFTIRLSFWVAAGLPVSFLGAMFFMGPLDLTVNMMTMVGLLLALGLLMDDAIVIAENVASHLAQGKSAAHAAVDGVREVLPGVFSSFLTTICVLGPLMFIAGDIGKVLRVVPMILVVVLAVSLVEAFLVLPSHLAHSLHGHDPARRGSIRRRLDAIIEWVRERGVGRSVDLLLRWRYLTIGVVLGIFLASLGLVAGGVLKFQAFPSLDGDVVQARILLPQGTPLARTEEVVVRVRAGLASVDARFTPQPGGASLVRHSYVQYNANADAFEHGPHVATVTVDLLSAEQRTARLDDVLAAWREEVGAPADVLSLAFVEPTFGPAGRAIEIRFRGPKLEDLKAASARTLAALDRFVGVSNLADDLRPGKPELRVQMRPGAYGLALDASSMARQLRGAYRGQTAAEIQVGDEALEIEVALEPAARDSLGDLDAFTFTLPDGSQVPMDAVATVESARGWARIARVDGARTVTLRGDVDERLANNAELVGALREELLPELHAAFPDVSVDFEGEAAESGKTQSSMARALLIGVFGIFVLLSFQFRSYIEPLIVMVAIPFALVGVIWGHLLMGMDLSMPSILGFISLAGVVVNDSILLVMFLKRERAAGCTAEDAARRASRRRFRAVMITSLTTMAGLLPLLAERSLQAQILIPIAISIVFGLLASTLLVLLVLPCLYTVLDDLGLTARRSSDEDEDEKARGTEP